MIVHKKKPIALILAHAIGVGAFVAIPAVAVAQSADSVEKVTITGSAIKRIESEGALPVQIINRAAIEQTGSKSVAELIQNLPGIQGFTHVSESVGGGGAGFSGASIHNIGETRTLVLLNGHRVSSWAGQTLTGAGAGIDLNSIPLSAIDRVELLNDGASALYGSDAVAGVINFILRTNQRDADVSITESVPKGGVGKQFNFSATKGWGDLQSDGFNVLFSYSRDKQNSMKAADRQFAKTGIINFSYGGKDYLFSNTSWRAAPANYDVYPQTGATDFTGNPYNDSHGGAGTCPAQHLWVNTGDGYPSCQFDYTSTVQIVPESQRDNLIASFTKQLNGNHTFSADVVWSKFEVTSKIAPPPVDMIIPTGSTLYNSYLGVIPGFVDGDELDAYWRGIDAGNRTTKDETTALHTTLSLKGTLSEWDYATSFTHSTNTWKESYSAGWLMQNELDAAIASAAFDPFLLPGNQSQAGQDAIAGMQFRGEYKKETSTIDVIDAKGSREVFKIGDQTAQIGAGVDFRRERVKYEPSTIAQGLGNNIAGDAGAEKPFDVSRNAWGLFVELVTPFSKQFELTTSLRHDHYADFGNTDNYKLAARFQPTKSLLFRASAGSGFRAPSVPQVEAGSQLYGVTGGTYTCTLAKNPGLVAGLAQVLGGDPTAQCRTSNSQYEQFVSGNRDLKPEKSQQWDLGFRFEPVDWASVGADWWNVDVKDRISSLSEDTVMNDTTGAYLSNWTVYNDPGTGRHYVALFLPNENLGEEKYSGIDLDGKLAFDAGVGKLTTTLHWTHMLKYEYQRVNGGAFFTNLGQFNDDSVTFRNIARLAIALKYRGFQHTLTTNFKSGYQDQPQTVTDLATGASIENFNHRVDDYYTFDWQTQYQGLIKGLTLTGGIQNFTNRAPPLTLKNTGGHQLGYDNRYTDPNGRTFYATLNYKF
jgi:iron complex outermembrane receptor protein